MGNPVGEEGMRMAVAYISHRAPGKSSLRLGRPWRPALAAILTVLLSRRGDRTCGRPGPAHGRKGNG